MEIVPRSQIGVPNPGTRAKLARPVNVLLAHYTGVNGYNDPSKDWAYARKVASYGVAAGKAYEYSYLIGLGGTVFEQAGEYRAAHCLNMNDRALGVLLMVGVGVAPSQAMTESFRQLRAHLVASGALADVHDCAPHYKYRATGCPGTLIATPPGRSWNSPTGEGREGWLLAPFLAAPTPVPQTSTVEEDDMASALKRYRDLRYTNVFLLPSGLHLSGEADRAYADDGVPMVEGQHEQMLDGLLHINGLDRSRLVPR